MDFSSMFIISLFLLVHVLQSWGHRIGVQVRHKKRSAQYNNFGSQIGQQQQQENICEDKRGDCVANKKLCHENSAHAEWMNTNCQRTCGKCNNNPSLPPERLHPVDCQWSPWTKQGNCSRSCGNGTQVFTRLKLVESKNGGHNCVGGITKHEHCNIQECPVVVDCQWSEWQYSPCSKTCGSGVKVISRTEKVKAQNGGLPCFGEGTKTEHCKILDCSVDCQWSEWHYGSCSKTCGSGVKVISRTERVKALNGGKPCIGDETKTEYCYIQDCPVVVDCQWSEWQYGPCSRTCGRGGKVISRTEKVKAQNGGKPCFGDRTKTELCNIQDCPIDCQWSEWHYGSCSRTCGGGVKVISRTERVKALNGGKPCIGDGTKTEHCYIKDCPNVVVDCEWSEWHYGPCSRTCGSGKQMISRTEKVKAQNGGRPCFGDGTKTEYCNIQDCPVVVVDCQWSVWNFYGSCSRTCGGGVRVISRTERVKAQNGGKPCFGDGTKTEHCNIQDCPIVVQPQTTQFNNYGSQIGQQIGGFGGFGGGQFNNAKVKHEPSMGNWGGIGGGFMNGWRGFGGSMFNKRKKREAEPQMVMSMNTWPYTGLWTHALPWYWPYLQPGYSMNMGGSRGITTMNTGVPGRMTMNLGGPGGITMFGR